MNIILIGSCDDSSYLAKELNKRLSSAIVARVDLLKPIKQLLLPAIAPANMEDVGAYLGDVESYKLSEVTEDKKKKISDLVNTIESCIPGCLTHSIKCNSMDSLTKAIPHSTYSFIKIYSGFIKDDSLQVCRPEDSIVIEVKNPKNVIFPTALTTEALSNLKKRSFVHIDVDNIEDVLKSTIMPILSGTVNVSASEESAPSYDLKPSIRTLLMDAA